MRLALQTLFRASGIRLQQALERPDSWYKLMQSSDVPDSDWHEGFQTHFPSGLFPLLMLPQWTDSSWNTVFSPWKYSRNFPPSERGLLLWLPVYAWLQSRHRFKGGKSTIFFVRVKWWEKEWYSDITRCSSK